MHLDSRRIWTVFFILLLFGTSNSQEYPRWFLDQRGLSCSNMIVGYANSSYFPDSSVAQAVLNGCENFVRNRRIHFSGGQAYWSTEAGTFWMGSDFKEEFDEGELPLVKVSLHVIDTMKTQNMTAVLMSPFDCELKPIEKITKNVSRIDTPKWTETPPEDDVFFYAVGVSNKYYYESSSWLEAERMARKNMARNVIIDVQAIQKIDDREGQEIRNEDVRVTMINLETVARWRDLRDDLFYVLIRMRK